MGYSVVTSVLSPAATYNLVDMPSLKNELGIDDTDPSEDVWLGRAVTQVSRAIARATNRVFAPELVQDSFDVEQDPYPYQTPGGFAQLELRRYPVMSIVSVVQTLAGGGSPTTQTLVEGIDFRADPETGRLLRLNPFTGVGTTWEAVPVVVQYVAGYGAMVTETDSVPASPYQVAVAQGSALSCVQSVAYASGAALVQVAANPAQGQFTLGAGGVFTFNAADDGQALTFVYATLVVPDDLVEIVLRMLNARYAGKDRDPALVQEDTGVGSRRWWFGGAPGQKGPFPPDIEAYLDTYRMPVMA